jgi:hypothetical protein
VDQDPAVLVACGCGDPRGLGSRPTRAIGTRSGGPERAHAPRRRRPAVGGATVAVSGGAQTTLASRLDLGLGGTVCNEICTRANLVTRGIDLWYSGRRAGDGGGEPLGEAESIRRRTSVSACGRCGAREHEQEEPGCSSPACGAPEGLLGDGEAADGGSRAAALLGFGGGGGTGA